MVAFRDDASLYLGTAVAGQSFIDLIDVGGHRLKAGIETVKSLLLYLFKRLLGFLRPLPGSFKLYDIKMALNKQTQKQS